MDWPPTLDDLKRDLKVEDARDDVRLQDMLDAAIAHVRELRAGSFNFDADPFSTLPVPGPNFALGTARLAGRWHIRGRSPDGLVNAGEFGNSIVPSLDVDLERLLGVGRYRGLMVG